MQTFSYTRHKKKESLIDFLVKRFPYQSRENWIKSIKTGSLKVNNSIVSSNTTLKSRDIISYERPRSDEPVVDTSYNILHCDDDILVVEKNGNIPIAESGRYYRNTLINILKEKEGFSELYAVHRLDKETSGVLLIARKKNIATRLGEQFLRKEPKKVYHAILRGCFTREMVTVDEPIGRCSPEESKIRIRQVAGAEKGKPSKTQFVAEKIKDGLTLARIRTFSGRTHQIRCHAEYIGYPILGDKLYGQTDDVFLEFLNGGRTPLFHPFGLISHQLLHASSLTFQHPTTDKELIFYSDYRNEFSKFETIRCWLED